MGAKPADGVLAPVAQVDQGPHVPLPRVEPLARVGAPILPHVSGELVPTPALGGGLAAAHLVNAEPDPLLHVRELPPAASAHAFVREALHLAFDQAALVVVAAPVLADPALAAVGSLDVAWRRGVALGQPFGGQQGLLQ